MAAHEVTALDAWVGKHEVREDLIAPAPVAGLSATLDHRVPRASTGEPLPPLWHWLYFLPTTPASEIDADGHARRGGFLPPVTLPRRMWAGSRVRFVSPLCVGDRARRVSTIASINQKKGRAGDLVFVTVRHEIYRGDTLSIEEEQDLVYRGATGDGSLSTPQPAPATAQWTRTIEPDPVLLFRYSAITFNSHRIHYDREYATRVEGYPGLVVQGPLTATLLLDALYRQWPDARLGTFHFRGVRPLVAEHSMRLEGRCEGAAIRLWALDDSGALAMSAQATIV